MSRLFLAVLAAGVVTLNAQSNDPLGARFEAAIRRTVPQSRPQEARVPSIRNYEMRRWLADDHEINLRYFVTGSVQSADQLFRFLIEVSEVPTVRVSGVGDDAYLFAPYSPTGQRRFHFRRGRVIVEVAAYGEALARQVAASFLEEVDRSRASGELDGRCTGTEPCRS
jgi:hypothetical protein